MKFRFLKNQKGSALLFVLGILTLVLMVAMGFAFTARTSRRVAVVNADTIKARLIAESARNDILNDMMLAAPQHTAAANKWYLPREIDNADISNAASEDGQAILCTAGSMAVGDDHAQIESLLNANDAIPSLDGVTLPAGVWFKDITDADGNIIGRFFSAAVEESNKIDLNRTLSFRLTNYDHPAVIIDKDATTMKVSSPQIFDNYGSSHFFYDIFGEGAPSNSIHYTEHSAQKRSIRLGIHPEELQYDSNYTPIMRTFAGVILVPWYSYSHILKTFEDYSDDFEEDKYTIFSAEDIEAYFKIDSGDVTAYQRFDLSGYEWADDPEDYYTASGIDTEKSGWNQNALDIVSGMTSGTDDRNEFYNSDGEPDTTIETTNAKYLIPYLATLTDDDIGKAIAANMVDFCDADNHVTLPFENNNIQYLRPHGGTIDHVPEYCGNEAVPACNEFQLIFDATVTEDNSATPPTKTYTVTYKNAYLEMLFPYQDDSTIPNDMRVIVTPKVRLQIIHDPSVSMSVSSIQWFQSGETGLYCGTFYFNFGKADFNGVSYKTNQNNTAIPSVVRSLTQDASLPPPKFKFTFEFVQMLEGYSGSSPAIDYGYWQETAEAPTDPNVQAANVLVVDFDQIGVTGEEFTMDWEVSDPRCNHLPQAWSHNDFSNCGLAAQATEHIGTLEGDPDVTDPRNKFYVDSTSTLDGSDSNQLEDCDNYPDLLLGTGTTKKTFSTAWIANRPFKSLWELGAIHRGRPFRTLDLLDVDRAILDQVKIGPQKVRYGTFNANSLNGAALLKLLECINVDSDYPDVSTTNSPRDNEGTTFTDSDIPTSFSLDSTINRSDFADLFMDIWENKDSSYRENYTKRQQEAPFGRTVGLLSTFPQTFSILSVGQALKPIDVDATGWTAIKSKILNPIEYNGHYYSLLSTQRMVSRVAYDPLTNSFKVLNSFFLDD